MYDLIEFLANMKFPFYFDNESLIHEFNEVLKKYNAAYRFVGTLLVEITSEDELDAIEESLAIVDNLTPVKRHLEDALRKLSHRTEPDYRNSIKESISSVEALCMIITGDNSTTLGKALTLIKKNDQVKIHGALNGALSQLYGYTSDADGIRHALMDEPNLDFEDAKFMFVSCSAFISYLLEHFA